MWSIPYPPSLTTVNPDLVAVVGKASNDVFVSTTSGTVYFWKSSAEEYISTVLPLHVLVVCVSE